MTRYSITVLILCTLLPAATTIEYTDPSGDVSGAAGPGTSARPESDFLAMIVEDKGAEIYIALRLAGMPTGDTAAQDGGTWYWMNFTIGDNAYRLDLMHDRDVYRNDRWVADLWQGDDWSRQPRYTIDVESAEIQIWIPRGWLTTATGAPPWGINGIENLVATSIMHASRSTPDQAVDRAPDTGSISWRPDFGRSEPSSPIRIERPLAQSNGGVQSFVFPVSISDAPSGTYEWTLANAPDSWTIAFPETIEVGANGSANDAILVSLPGAHGHGNVDEVRIQMIGPATAEIVVGIAFATPAFPTGHHPTLFLHARNAGEEASAFMNAAREDARDAVREVPLAGDYEKGGLFDYRLDSPLESGLGIGMLADPARNATISIEVVPTAAQVGLLLQANLVLVGDSSRTVLWEFPRAMFAPTLTAGAPVLYEFEGTWAGGETEIIPYNETNLVLEIFARETAPSALNPSRPMLRHGGELELPLFEFVDDTRSYFDQYTDFEISTDEPNIVRLAPNAIAVLPGTVENKGADAVLVDVLFTESRPGWVSLDAESVLVKEGERRVVNVVVEAATADLQNDVRLQFHAGGRLIGVQGFSFFLDAESERDDESPTDSNVEKESSSSSIVVLLVGLGVTLAVYRRGRACASLLRP